MGCAEKPLVSVIMPAYNAARYIRESVQSVQNQTFDNWELIVIDDCSEDNTVAVVTQLAQDDSRICVYSNEHNSGVAKTRNRGLELCNGEYVAFLDSDDTWYPEKIEIQLKCFRETGADLICTSYAIVDAQGRKQCEDFLVPECISFHHLLKENVIGCSTVMFRRAAGNDVCFEEDFYHEDYVLWLRLLKRGYKAIGIKKVLVNYFFHSDSKAGNKRKAAQNRWRVYRNYLGLSLVKSAWYFTHYALAGLRKYKKVS